MGGDGLSSLGVSSLGPGWTLVLARVHPGPGGFTRTSRSSAPTIPGPMAGVHRDCGELTPRRESPLRPHADNQSLQLAPTGGKRTRLRRSAGPDSAHGRETYAVALVSRASSCQWAGSVRGGAGEPGQILPVGGKRTRLRGSAGPDSARGREAYAVALVSRASSCPWAGNVRVCAGEPRQILPVGGKRTRSRRSARLRGGPRRPATPRRTAPCPIGARGCRRSRTPSPRGRLPGGSPRARAARSPPPPACSRRR